MPVTVVWQPEAGVTPFKLLFEMSLSVPQFFITAPRALNRASGSEEGATTESLQKIEGVLKLKLPHHASQDPSHVKNLKPRRHQQSGECIFDILKS